MIAHFHVGNSCHMLIVAIVRKHVQTRSSVASSVPLD